MMARWWLDDGIITYWLTYQGTFRNTYGINNFDFNLFNLVQVCGGWNSGDVLWSGKLLLLLPLLHWVSEDPMTNSSICCTDHRYFTQHHFSSSQWCRSQCSTLSFIKQLCYRKYNKPTSLRLNKWYIIFYHLWFWIIVTGNSHLVCSDLPSAQCWSSSPNVNQINSSNCSRNCSFHHPNRNQC